MTSSRWHSSFTQSVSHRGEARQLERRAFRHEYLFSPEGAIGMRFSTRGRRRKFCDEGAALSPPPPPFSRVPPPPPSLPCLACLALFLLVPPPDRCPHHFRVLFFFLPLSLALFLSLFLSSPSTAFFGRPSRHAAFEFSPSRCHCTTLAVLPSQRLYTPSNGHSRKSAQRHSYAPVLQRPS